MPVKDRPTLVEGDKDPNFEDVQQLSTEDLFKFAQTEKKKKKKDAWKKILPKLTFDIRSDELVHSKD